MLTRVGTGDAWQEGQLQREFAEVLAQAGSRADTMLRLPDVGALLSGHLAGRPDPGQLPHRHAHGLHDGADALGAAPGGLPGRPRRRSRSRASTSSTATTCSPADPMTGERDIRSEDRQLLLDAVVRGHRKAGDHLHRRRRAHRPSAAARGAAGRAARRARPDDRIAGSSNASSPDHPLQPFDRKNVTPGALVYPASRSPSTRPRCAAAEVCRRQAHRAPRSSSPDRCPRRRPRTSILADLLGIFQRPGQGLLPSAGLHAALGCRRASKTRCRSRSTPWRSGRSATGCCTTCCAA